MLLVRSMLEEAKASPVDILRSLLLLFPRPVLCPFERDILKSRYPAQTWYVPETRIYRPDTMAAADTYPLCEYLPRK